jgi:hypothetical protein
VLGITTDGSSLYPKVLKELWPKTRHQICEFHVQECHGGYKRLTGWILRL